LCVLRETSCLKVTEVLSNRNKLIPEIK